MKYIWKQSLTLSAVFALILIAGNIFAEEFQFDYQKTIDIQKPTLVNLELVKGNVTVIGTDENQIVIEAKKIIRASNRDEAEEFGGHIEIKIKQDGAKIFVQTNDLDLLNRKPSFWQKIPGGGSNVISDVSYKIMLPFNCGISLKAMDADVELTNVENPVFVEKSTGRVKSEFIIGPVSIVQAKGDIDLQWIEGDIQINTQSCNVAIRQTRGALKLSSYNGNVDIQTELDSPGEFSVETMTGNIAFAVPFTAAGALEIATESGHISSQIPVEIKSLERNRIIGTFGGGGAKVRLNSNSGSVILAQF